MSPEEHLNRIVAKCRELLAANAGSDRAKAGWRATIAAIEGLRLIANSETSADPHESCDHPTDAQKTLQQIIAAWPEELL